MVGQETARRAVRLKPQRFRNFIAVDWSGATGERHKGIALALCRFEGGPPELLEREKPWSRAEVLAFLLDELPPDTLVGFDLGMSLPFEDSDAYFPGWPGSPATARELWALIDEVCRFDPHLAATSFVDHSELNRYFRRHGGREGDRFHIAGAGHKRGRFRVTEEAQARMGCKPYSNFNLVGAAQVGKSSLTGMRLLHRLNGALPVWPVDPLLAHGSVVVEIYTALAAVAAGRKPGRAKMKDFGALNAALRAFGSPPVGGTGSIDDHSADALVTAAWLRREARRPELWQPEAMTDAIAQTEGWTFGAL